MTDAIVLSIIIVCAALMGFTVRHAFVPIPTPRRFYDLTDAAIARIVHEANRAFCLSHGDMTHRAWINTPEHVRQSTIEGVAYLRRNPHLTPQQMHENWSAAKLQQGYRYGQSKCHHARTHPCLVPYDQLPAEQQFKDHLFHAIVGLFTVTPRG